MNQPTASGAATLTRRWGPFVILLGVIAACLAPLWIVPPGTERKVEQALSPPFRAGDSGWFVGKIRRPTLWNRKTTPNPVVFENGNRVGNARSTNPFMGLFDPSNPDPEPQISFPTSDGSDPTTNGRSYTIRYDQPVIALPIYLGVVTIAALAAFLFLALAAERGLSQRPRLQRLALAFASVVLGAALLQGIPAVLLADRLGGSMPDVRNYYDQVFQGTSGGRVGNTSNYRVHPYLNFALNPDAAYMNEHQFNAHYSIRRKEPIRPRSEVTWRALALGGSTTFGERTAREEDTWVYRLEQKMRAAHGPGYDVINGGVGGYNIIENFIHYVLLLDELQPDIVILYVGINDVHPRLMDDLARDYTNSRVAWRGEDNTLPEANSKLTPFALYRFLMLREVERREFGHIYLYVQHLYPPVGEWAAALKRNGTEVYQAHLENLVRLILAQGHQVVIVPQIFIPVAGNEGDEVFDIGVQEHNVVNATVADKYHVPFVGSVSGAFGKEDLMDNCHFTAKGQEKMAAKLFDFFAQQPAAKPAITP